MDGIPVGDASTVDVAAALLFAFNLTFVALLAFLYGRRAIRR